MYIFILVWLLLWWWGGNSRKLLHLIIAIFPVFLMIAFRAESVGKDTSGYLYAYNSFNSNISLIQLWNEWDTEKGYVALCYFLKHIGFGQQSVLFAEALVFCFSIIYFCKYCAGDKLFILMITVLQLSEFAISGIRQTFALSFFLIAYRFAQEKRWVMYTLLGIIAIQFHTSAALVFPCGILIHMKFNNKVLWLYICVLVFSLLFIGAIFNKISSMLDYDEYQLMSIEGGYVSFAASLLFCLVILDRYKLELCNFRFQQASHYTLLFAMFSAVRFVNVMIMRVLLYLSVFPYLMVDSMQESRKSQRFKALSITYCVAYFIYRLSELDKYHFYWN